MTIILSGMLSGCANKYAALTPELQASMMSDLRDGKLNLDCGGKCLFTWIAQAPVVHQLDIAENWNELAPRVMQIGYGNDLAYYYLGQAAQGLGYHKAAIGYYSYSSSLTYGQNPLLKCSAGQGNAQDPCQGVDLAGSIPVLIQASRDAMVQQAAADAAAAEAANTPAPTVHHHHRKTAVAQKTQDGSGWVAPPPAATQASASSATGSGASGWAAPPPVQH